MSEALGGESDIFTSALHLYKSSFPNGTVDTGELLLCVCAVVQERLERVEGKLSDPWTNETVGALVERTEWLKARVPDETLER